VRKRFARFNLALADDRTRLLEFGPFAINNRQRRGAGKPETFNFLGFAHLREEDKATECSRLRRRSPILIRCDARVMPKARTEC